MDSKQALIHVLLRLGDTALIHGHRLSEWCSKGPFLEEDLALTNIALDHIGKAQAFLNYAGEVEGLERNADDLAYKRDERHFYNFLLAELPNGDFAYTITRLLFLAQYECLLYDLLSNADDEVLKGIAVKSLKESKYHLAHASSWVKRLGLGTEESHGRMQNAINQIWTYTGELFESNEGFSGLKLTNNKMTFIDIADFWHSQIRSILAEANLQIPNIDFMQTGGAKGIHTEHLGHLLAEMQFLQRAYPDAKW